MLILKKINKKITLIIKLLFLIQLFFLNSNLINSTTIYNFNKLHNNAIISQNSDGIYCNIYNTTKNIRLNITCPHAKFFPEQKNISFLHPNIFIFKKNKNIWQIKCNQAVLNYNKLLILYGFICIENTTNHQSIQSMITNHALIDLTNLNVIANNYTIIYGSHFYSIGSKMHINLRNQTVKLFGKIYTQYDTIQK